MLVTRSNHIALSSSSAPRAELPASTKRSGAPREISASAKKTVGITSASAKAFPPKPSIHKLGDDEVVRVLGKSNSLAQQTSIYQVNTAVKPLPKALEAGVDMIAKEQQGSLNVETMKPVSKAEAIKAIMKGTDESTSGDMFTRDEVGALMHYLDVVSASAKIYMAHWDDSSTEYMGYMVAVQNPANDTIIFAQVNGFLP